MATTATLHGRPRKKPAPKKTTGLHGHRRGGTPIPGQAMRDPWKHKAQASGQGGGGGSGATRSTG